MTFRVHVLGASGSGTTALGVALASHLKVPHFDTDDYFWLPSQPPFRKSRPREERLLLLEPKLQASSSWVLSGSLRGWGDPLIRYFDLVVFLWMPREVRLARLREREGMRYGREAIGPGGPLHAAHREFLEWAASYDDGPLTMRSRVSHEKWLSQLPCPVLRLEGRATNAERLRVVLDHRDRIEARGTVSGRGEPRTGNEV